MGEIVEGREVEFCWGKCHLKKVSGGVGIQKCVTQRKWEEKEAERSGYRAAEIWSGAGENNSGTVITGHNGISTGGWQKLTMG